MNRRFFKIGISLTIFLILGLSTVYFFFLSPVAIMKRKVAMTYNKVYAAVSDSCETWQGTIPSLPERSFISNMDTNYIYNAILLERYKALDRSTLPYIEMVCTPDEISDANRRAKKNAEIDFLKRKYGDNFYEKVRDEAHLLDEKFRVAYYNDILKGTMENLYRREMINDTMEVGILDLTLLDSLPFRIEIDTSLNSKYFTIKKTDNGFLLFATKLSEQEKTNYLLPTIKILAFFDSTKTDFPYQRFAIRREYLKGKYEWEGGKYGMVKTDSVKASRNGKTN